MAAFLTEAQVATVTWVTDYLNGNVEKPLDEKSIYELSKIAEQFGFSQINFMQAMKDSPVRTLLLAVLYLNANA